MFVSQGDNNKQCMFHPGIPWCRDASRDKPVINAPINVNAAPLIDPSVFNRENVLSESPPCHKRHCQTPSQKIFFYNFYCQNVRKNITVVRIPCMIRQTPVRILMVTMWGKGAGFTLTCALCAVGKLTIHLPCRSPFVHLARLIQYQHCMNCTFIMETKIKRINLI